MQALFDYDQINKFTSIQQPNTVHCRNAWMQHYFARYLLQKFIGVYEWEGIPENWSKDYLLYNLYAYGYVTVFNTDKFGVIPQQCSLYGYNIYYLPTNCIVANPLIRIGPDELKIGRNCELIKITPDYQGFTDIIFTYSDMMALCMESVAVSLVNAKTAYVFKAKDKPTAESFKKMYDQINAGNPAVVIDKELGNDNSAMSWDMFNNNVATNYISDRLLNDLRTIENMFCTEIGIPNINTQKKERMITDEVLANRDETYTNAKLWLSCLQESLQKVNKMFNLNISVKMRFGGENSNGNALNSGIV